MKLGEVMWIYVLNSTREEVLQWIHTFLPQLILGYADPPTFIYQVPKGDATGAVSFTEGIEGSFFGDHHYRCESMVDTA